MLRFAICDDNAAELEQTASLLRDYLQHRPQLEAGVSLFDSGQALLDAVAHSGGFELYLLDVIMPGCNGIELGKRLRGLGDAGAILYLTTSPDYAVDSYLTQAFFYLLKPVNPQQLFEVLDRAVGTLLDRKSQTVMVNTKTGMRSIPLCDILYLERVGRFVRYYLSNGETLDSRTIRGSFHEAVAEPLSNHSFVLCGASFVLNLGHVKSVERGVAFLDNGAKVSVSQSALAGLKRSWMEYWLGTC